MSSLKSCLALVVVSVLLLLYVWERVSIVQLGYDAEQLKQTRTELERRHDRLRAELSRLTSPTHLEQLARKQLSMGPPEPGQVILVQLERRSDEDHVPQAPAQIEVASRRQPGSSTTIQVP